MNLTSKSISYKKTQNFRKIITDKVPKKFGNYKVSFLSHFNCTWILSIKKVHLFY